MKSKLVPLFIFLSLLTGLADAEDIEGGFLYDGIDRTYLLHLPPSYNGADSLPLVVNMHGLGGSGPKQAIHSRMNLKADAEGFYVVYPNGTGTIKGWNAGTCCGEADDVGFISVLIDTIRANYVVDTMRVFACGFSNGGMMSHRLACELSGRIAAVAPVAGGLIMEDWDNCRPPRAVPIIHFHARDDSTAKYYGSEILPATDSVMETWAEWDSCDVGPDTFFNGPNSFRQTWSQSEGDVEVVFWTTEDGGHSWPGVPGGSQAISANDLMWDFFVAHPMPGAEEPGIEEFAEPTFQLNPVFIDPTATSTIIRFTLARQERVSLRLFDVSGRMIAVLAEDVLESGNHSVQVDASELSAGVYFYRLSTTTRTEPQSFRLIK